MTPEQLDRLVAALSRLHEDARGIGGLLLLIALFNFLQLCSSK